MVNPKLQWDFRRSHSHSLPRVEEKVIRACATDNVQSLALLACEAFGATLAICHKTLVEIRQQVVNRQSGLTTPIHFVGATAGYSLEDCGTYLCHSNNGRSFLALAATMVPGISHFRAGQAVAKMLEASTAADKTLLPSARHLKDIFSSIEHRCVQFGFSDMVEDWRLRLRDRLEGVDLSCLESTRMPDVEFMEKLIGAFRDLKMAGHRARIILETSPSCIPWAAAFTTWCLGIEPNVATRSRKNVFSDPQSQVTLLEAHSDRSVMGTFQIHFRQTFSGPERLYWGYLMPRSGMIRLEHYGPRMVEAYGVSSIVEIEDLPQVLPYALKQLSKYLRVRTDRNQDGYSDPPDGFDLLARPFPEDAKIEKTLGRLFGKKHDWTLKELPRDMSFFSLSLLKELPAHEQNDNILPVVCFVILVITLFELGDDLADSLLLCEDIGMRSSVTGLTEIRSREFKHPVSDYIHRALNGEPSMLPLDAVLEFARALIGHTRSYNDDEAWIISSYHGQTIYPRIFETCEIDHPGYLTLNCTPGVLWYRKEKYTYGSSSITRFSLQDPEVLRKFSAYRGLTRLPANLFHKYRVGWSVLPEDNWLRIRYCLFKDREYIHDSNPLTILKDLSSAFVVVPCVHDPQAKITRVDRFTSPFHPAWGGMSDGVFVVGVYGRNDLRMFILSCAKGQVGQDGIRMVVRRKNACLNCCLDICDKTDSLLIIC